jgi:hypothetical protein
VSSSDSGRWPWASRQSCRRRFVIAAVLLSWFVPSIVTLLPQQMKMG